METVSKDTAVSAFSPKTQIRKPVTDRTMLAALAAYFYGQGYFVDTFFRPPKCNGYLDLAAVMPRIREMKPRLTRGFAPSGVISYLLDNAGWVSVRQLAQMTGYSYEVVGKLLEEANTNGWIELDLTQPQPLCRLLDYRVPASEMLIAFDGMHDLAEKVRVFKMLAGAFDRGYFAFTDIVDNETIEYVRKTGAGVLRFYEKHGMFLEILPSEEFAIIDETRRAMLIERTVSRIVFRKSLDELI